MLKKIVTRNIRFAVFLAVTIVLSLVGCSNSTTTYSNDESGIITGSLLEAANSNIIATSDSGEYLIPVDSYGRFSSSLPVGVYSLSYRSSTNDKLILTNKKIIIVNNVTISVVDAELVPQPQILYVNVPVIGANSAIIEWETDIESDGYVEYGTNELYGVQTYVSTEQTKQHRIQITGLMSDTTYHFRVVASRHHLDTTTFISSDYTLTTNNY